MKYSGIKIVMVMLAVSMLTACVKKLDRFPANTLTSEDAYKDLAGYKRVLARVYGSMVLTSQNAPATGGFGNGDVKGVDEGFSDFFRNYWTIQDMSTDMAKWKWADPGLYDIQFNRWGADNPLVEGMYGRCMLVITFANEFLRESTPEKINARGINANEIKTMRAEVRFVRAYMYWALMDLFGNPGFVTENDPFGTFTPPQIKRADLYKWIDDELKAIEADLPAPRANEYGRADKAIAWALRARMSLNASVYLSLAQPAITDFTPYYTEAVANSKKVIDAGYTLMPNYQWLFLADNHIGNTEAIWTLNYDGVKSQSYGGATFIINGTASGDRQPLVQLGGLGGWGAMRATEKIPQLFPDVTGAGDKRSLWYTDSQTESMNDFFDYQYGYPTTKYRNRTRSGGYGNDPNRTFADIDIPVSRLAEMYLIYAEAVKRGGTGGSESQALIYLNALRTRAQVTAAPLGFYTLDYVLDERARELYWEGFRRMDLIRYGRYAEANYLWPWKGGVRNETAFDVNRKILPIPSKQLAVNPNLKQNPGY